MSTLPPAPDPATGPGLLRYVRSATRVPHPRWYLGLDLGQRRDHSALSMLELSWEPQGQCRVDYSWLFQPRLAVRTLERFPLGVSYERLHLIILERLRLLDRHEPAPPSATPPFRRLIVDAGGPGPPVVDRLRLSLPRHVRLSPVIITGGRTPSLLSGGYDGIPRRAILSRLIHMIACGSLVAPKVIDGWQQFRAEMLDLSGDSTHPASPGAHDDLVIAVGLAAWAAAADTPELLPGREGSIPDLLTAQRRLL